MRRFLSRILVVLSTLVFIVTTIDWYRSLRHWDSVRWVRYLPSTVSLREERETTAGVADGRIWIMQERVKCDPSTATRFPIPSEWYDEAGVQFNVEPPFYSDDSGPEPKFQDQLRYEHQAGSPGPFVSIWGTWTRQFTITKVPLWPVLFLSGILPTRVLIRWIRATRTKGRGFDVATHAD